MTKRVSTQYLADLLIDSNKRSMELVNGLDDKQMIGPKLPIVNPLLWEIGHVAWFYEQFILRMLYKELPILDNGDDLYDSIDVEHFARWDLPLLNLEKAIIYIDDVRNKLINRLGEISETNMASEQDSFIYQFATFHEDMHTEAYTYSRNTLKHPLPNFETKNYFDNKELETGPLPGDVDIPGGSFNLGAS